ncbi:sigma-54-dependent transcriptional regulator [Gemmatimonas sp.]|jgi:DNA-binding NtrC family response regulator|uniref:sigma-54-dependent transcriptional regulator n=1 Tax=Gemmatimonas sp. TaxID=1962908 RepID=UPI0037C09D01
MSNVALYNTEVPSAFPLARGASLTTRVPTGRDRQLRIAPEGQVSSPTPSHALMRILVVSPNAQACTALRAVFEREGREVLSASSPAGVVEMIGRAEVDLLISDQLLPDDSGYALLESVRDQHPTVMTALMAAPGMSQAPLLAFERGASDFLTQPIDAEEAVAFLRRAEQLHAVRGHVARPSTAEYEAPDFRGMYGTTSVMRDVFKMITRVGRTGVTVLVTGESGTGKELVARALHDESARRNKPFIALNCSALPSELVESELFGHTRGAFTGAVKDRGGLFEAAHDGTLFLDEIGDLGPLAQAKVLRAVESGEVMRVGGTKSSHVDVRVIAATNRPLDEMVLDGRFREDLLYRLKVISLALPPLRERKSDIPLLASHFLHVFAERHSLPARALSPDARDMLMQYDWPGNVRELRNVIEGALVMCDGAEIAVCDLPSSLTTASPRLSVPTSLMEQSADLPFVEARERALREFDRAFLGAALSRNGGNIARTARALGLHRQSLQKLLARRDLRNGETVREL